MHNFNVYVMYCTWTFMKHILRALQRNGSDLDARDFV